MSSHLLFAFNNISQYEGGNGVFREVCEILLKANNKWDEIINK